MPRPLPLLFYTLFSLALVSAFWQHAHLPPRVATHFDGAGRANGWLARETHTALQVTTLLTLTALLQGVIVLTRRLPREYINLPHRDYWLAPERAAASREAIATSVLQIGCAVLAFITLLFHFVYRANLTPTPRLGTGIWWATGAQLVTLAAVLVRLVTRFARQPAT